MYSTPRDVPKDRLPKELERKYEELEEALDKESLGWHTTSEITRLEKWIEDAERLLHQYSPV